MLQTGLRFASAGRQTMVAHRGGPTLRQARHEEIGERRNQNVLIPSLSKDEE
jgi:hypothetical protein